MKQDRHGKSKTKAYNTWKQMKKRCLNPNFPGYKNYGGRFKTEGEAYEARKKFEEEWRAKNG